MDWEVRVLLELVRRDTGKEEYEELAFRPLWLN